MASSYLDGKNFTRYLDDVCSFRDAGQAFTGIASEYGRAGLHLSEGRIKCRDCRLNLDLKDVKLCCPRKQHCRAFPNCKYLAETFAPDHAATISTSLLHGKGEIPLLN